MVAHELVARVIDEGERSWGFVAPSAALIEHLQRVGVDDDTLASHGPDLCLAAACAVGLPCALSVLESAFLSQVPQYVARICRETDRVEEIRQDLRVRMLVGPPPRIATYAGAGPLATFL